MFQNSVGVNYRPSSGNGRFILLPIRLLCTTTLLQWIITNTMYCGCWNTELLDRVEIDYAMPNAQRWEEHEWNWVFSFIVHLWHNVEASCAWLVLEESATEHMWMCQRGVVGRLRFLFQWHYKVPDSRFYCSYHPTPNISWKFSAHLEAFF